MTNPFAAMMAPLLAHEFNLRGAMQRAAQAKALGLDPQEFANVYPGSNLNVTVYQQGATDGATPATASTASGSNTPPVPLAPKASVPAASGLSTLAKVGLAAALTLGGGGAGAGLMALLKPAAAAKAAPAIQWEEEELVEQQQQPDGTWQDVRVIGNIQQPKGGK